MFKIAHKIPMTGYKVNVDSSYHRSFGMEACGGLIMDWSGKLINGFYCNLGSCNLVWAELWTLRLGIKLARELSLNPVSFEMNSQVVVNMI